MNSFTIKQQLGFAFATLALLVLVVSLLALRGLGDEHERFARHVAEIAGREALVGELSRAVNARAIAARNMVLVKSAADRQSENERVTGAHREVQSLLQTLQAAVGASSQASEQDRAFVAEIARVEAAYGPVALAIVGLAMEGRQQEAADKMTSECRPLLAELLQTAGKYLAYSGGKSRESVAASEDSYAGQRLLLSAVSLAALVAAALLGWLITRRLTAALGAEPADLRRVTQRVAAGDLSPVAGADAAPAGSVLASMGAMQAQLQGLIGQVRGAADSIATASTQIAQGNQDLSGRTEQQAGALEETAASMEQLGSAVRQNADHARHADEFARGASAVAIRGGDVVGQVVETMKEINASSKQIAEIIGVIDGIAFQTNILALNAAVEAARAGDEGRGFAVVASEVRGLAQRSAEAAKQIKGLISASVQGIERGTALVDEAGTTMSEIVVAITRVTDLMGEISSATLEQSTGVAQVGEAVSQMDRATQQNAALVEQSAAAAESLRVQAGELVDAVAMFRLAPTPSTGELQPSRGGHTMSAPRAAPSSWSALHAS